MSFFCDVTSENDWLSPTGEFRQHAQLLITKIILDKLAGSNYVCMDGAPKFIQTRGVFLQEHLLREVALPIRLLIKAGVLDTSGLMVRIAFTIHTEQGGKGFARCVFGANASEDTLSLRRALKQLVADVTAQWDGQEKDEFRTLLHYVPLSDHKTVSLGREWTFLCRP